MSYKERIPKWQAVWLASAWLLVGVVVYLSLVRLDMDIPEAGNSDKIAHLVAYAALTFWFMQVYVTFASRFVIAAALIVLGIALEFLQGYTGYRMFDYADMIANSIGVIVGWLVSPPRTPSVLSVLQSYISR